MRKMTLLAHIASIALTVIFAGVFLAAGIFLIVAPCRGYKVDPIIEEHNRWSMIIGALMILMFVKYLFFTWYRGRKHQSISFDNPDGAVEIAVHAIEESISRLVGSYSEVKGAYPSISATSDGLDVVVRVILWDDTNVQAISQKIQSETKAHVTSFFGVANVNTVRVFVTGTARRGASKTVGGESDSGDETTAGGANAQF
jgi:uncharacterized alkaline shock family protein YloU